MNPNIYTGLAADRRKAYLREARYYGFGNLSLEETVFKAITLVTNVTKDEMKSKCRLRYIVTARRMFFVFMIKYSRTLSGDTIPIIPLSNMINRNNATCLHHLKLHNDLLEYEQSEVQIRDEVDQIINKLRINQPQ